MTSIKLLIPFFVFFLGQNIFGQELQFQSNINLVVPEIDSINQDSFLELHIHFDNISYLGGIDYSVYSQTDNTFLFERNLSVNDMLNEGSLIGNEYKTFLIPYNQGLNLQVDINPYDINGAFTENQVIITNF